MSRFINVVVKNETDLRIGRGGKCFNPHEQREVYVTETQLKEIRACSGLLIVMENSKEAEKEFSCPLCKEFVCNSKKDLKKHIRDDHPDDYAKLKISR